MSPDRPKLAYVVNSLNPGGTERLVVEMARAFASEFSVLVVCLDEPGQWAERVRRMGIPVHGLWRQPGLDIGLVSRLAKLLRSFRIDLIHAHQCTAWFYSALSRLYYRNAPLILEEHGRFFPETENFRRRFVNRYFIRRLTQRYVAVSDDVRARLSRYEGLDLDEIEVIYNGVERVEKISDEKRLEFRSSLGFKQEEFVVGTVGRFDPIKNLPLLVNSIDRARRSVPRVRGLFIGDGPEMVSIKTQVKELKLAETIQLAGYRDDASQVMQCLDAFVLSSFSEGTSLALLEAMYSGVPVIVTEVGGNPELVRAGITGRTVPSEDVEALSSAIVDAVMDSERSAVMSVAARRQIDERFSFDLMIQKYRQLYCEVLGASSAGNQARESGIAQ